MRAEIHAHLRAKGRTACTWEIGTHATAGRSRRPPARARARRRRADAARGRDGADRAAGAAAARRRGSPGGRPATSILRRRGSRRSPSVGRSRPSCRGDPEPDPDNVVYLAYVDGEPVARGVGVVLRARGRAVRRLDAAGGARPWRVSRARRGSLGGRSRAAAPRRSSRRPRRCRGRSSSSSASASCARSASCSTRSAAVARVRVSAKADYAIRAAVELAAAGEGPTKGDRIAQAQEIPLELPREHPGRPAQRRHRRPAGAAPTAATGLRARRPRSASPT